VSHWIIAPVVLPAVLGAFIVLSMRSDLVLQRIFGLAGTIALCLIAGALVWHSSRFPPEAYLLGDWPAPFGIVLMLDRLSAMMVALTAVLALIVQLYAMGSGWDTRGRHFYALMQFQLMGLCGAFLTGDLFNLFVFFEVLLIASYGLMIHGGGRDRLRAGVQYVAFNLIGSTLFLFALATLYSVTGTLNMADLAEKTAILPAGDAALLRVAAVLLALVFAIKGALVPLHFWLPVTYANSPGPVAALFAVMTKVGAYSVIRVFNVILPPETSATGTLVADLLLPAALVTLVIGALGVLAARSLKRMVAFAAIASMGTLFISIAQFSPAATTAALYYLIHSTFATAALFLIVDLVNERRGTTELNSSLPVMPQSGLIASIYFMAAIAMAGMPPLSGFLGKLLILQATRADAATVWTTILATSLLTIVGLAAAGSTLFWKPHASGAPSQAMSVATAPAATLPLVAIGALLVLIVVLTLFSGPIVTWLAATTASLEDPSAYIAANALPDGG
jgi:multicomponent K+:H+ antiporter subunit D